MDQSSNFHKSLLLLFRSKGVNSRGWCSQESFLEKPCNRTGLASNNEVFSKNKWRKIPASNYTFLAGFSFFLFLFLLFSLPFQPKPRLWFFHLSKMIQIKLLSFRFFKLIQFFWWKWVHNPTKSVSNSSPPSFVRGCYYQHWCSLSWSNQCRCWCMSVACTVSSFSGTFPPPTSSLSEASGHSKGMFPWKMLPWVMLSKLSSFKVFFLYSFHFTPNRCLDFTWGIGFR